MPFALITIGVLILFTAINNTAGAFGKQIYKDVFSSDGGFAYWVAGIVIVGLIGYVPSLKKPSDLFMILIIISMLLTNKGFFTQLQQGLKAGPGGATPAAQTGSGTAAATGASTVNPSFLTSNTLASDAQGNIINASTGVFGTTTPLPGLGSGGIGAA